MAGPTGTDLLSAGLAVMDELRETLQSFHVLYEELPTHKQRELLGYIIKSISVVPTHIEMALFGGPI